MSRRLPLFPINVVLFPGTPLPLHIFEPRYRTLVADCLEGDERFGILPSGLDGGVPALGATGCTAHIRASQLLPDGGSNIVVVGESRFTVDQYLEESLPYAVAMVTEFDDEDEDLVSTEQINELRRLSKDYLEALHQLNDSLPTGIEYPDDSHAFSFQVSAALELDPEIKQRLLSVRSTVERIRLLLRIMPPLVRELDDRASVHQKARENGKSHRGFHLDHEP
jgi:ATP-dependent Lon protease